MSKKRRVFDIDMPEDSAPETFPAGKVSRRGPMAEAITDNAKSLAEREEIEAEIRAENDALAHEHVRMKGAGLVVSMVPLDQIATYKLVRDRSQKQDLELESLVTSIRDLGLSNPIRVEETGEGGYELIQGFRRVQAYQALLTQTGDAKAWGAIPALVVPHGETLEQLYRRMVDENLVRKDISFAEMAVLAIDYARDPSIEESDPAKAVKVLFESTSYSKRSHIRSFIRVMEALRDVLEFPNEVPRALGSAVAGKLEAEPGLARRIKKELEGWPNRSVKEEQDVLRQFAGDVDDAAPGEAEAKTFPAGKVSKAPKAKTTIEFNRPQGRAKCVAGAGRIEIRLDRDFSAIDRHRLEGAVQSLLDQLD